MKKTCTLYLKTGMILLTILMFTGCSAFVSSPISNEEDYNKFLISKSVDLTLLMDELATCDDYISAVASNTDMIGLLDEISKGSYGNPIKATVIELSDDTIDFILKEQLAIVNMPEDVQTFLNRRIINSFSALINQSQGVVTIAATNMIAVSSSYQQPKGFDAHVIVVLDYGTQYYSIVTFNPSEENTVMANATFVILTGELKEYLSNDDLFKIFFEEIDDIEIKVNEISESEIEKLLSN